MNIDDKTSVEFYKDEKYVDKLLRTALDIAENILRCGGAVHRAEETVERICKSYGATHVEVFSITSVIIASIRLEDGEHSMQTRRIYAISNNFTKLDLLNSISRNLCERKISLDEAQNEILLAKNTITYSVILRIFASMIVSGAFTVFFGGTWLDSIASAVVGLIVAVASNFAPKALNQLAMNLILSTIAGFLAIFFSKIGFGDNYDKMVIGTIMLVIPGLSFGTAIRDLLCGDTLSGILQLIQSILLAAIIAFGCSIAVFCLGAWIN